VWTVGACAAAGDPPRAAAGGPDDKERTGTLVGELKSRAEAKNGRSVTIEVLAPGEEKARRYLVAYDPRDPAAEKPYKELRAKVDAAGVGDRVRLTWVNAPKGSEGGFFVTGFEVLRKADRKDGRGENP
jgi:hypothetical protein